MVAVRLAHCLLLGSPLLWVFGGEVLETMHLPKQFFELGQLGSDPNLDIRTRNKSLSRDISWADIHVCITTEHFNKTMLNRSAGHTRPSRSQPNCMVRAFLSCSTR